MKCPNCGSIRIRVLDAWTEASPRGRKNIVPDSVERRRACIACGARWKTIEVHQGQFIPQDDVDKRYTRLLLALRALVREHLIREQQR